MNDGDELAADGFEEDRTEGGAKEEESRCCGEGLLSSFRPRFRREDRFRFFTRDALLRRRASSSGVHSPDCGGGGGGAAEGFSSSLQNARYSGSFKISASSFWSKLIFPCGVEGAEGGIGGVEEEGIKEEEEEEEESETRLRGRPW